MTTTDALPERVIDALDIHLRITEFKDKYGIDLREYYEQSDPPYELRPGKKGIRLPIAYLPALVRHLTALESEARALGLITEETP